MNVIFSSNIKYCISHMWRTLKIEKKNVENIFYLGIDIVI